ncbi:uncharacterized protein LOC132722454 [Ruditapes philippinarum]|uniref:uncharacterized protein LOC132722454 n=1 Tax=Ruditapes philippinarum TaxID=129788 RepID=UPI00295B639E|nr:uncharacterized protein LOC132722454 [Ruditapes philippinarum]
MKALKMDKIKFAVIVIIITIFVNGINCDSDCDCKSIKELQEFMKKDLYENKFEISKMNSRLRRLETSMRSFTNTNNKAPSTESGELSTSGVKGNETQELLETEIDDEISTGVTNTTSNIKSEILDQIEMKVTSLSLQVQDLKKTNAVSGKVVTKTLSAEKGSRKKFEFELTNAVENISNSVSEMKIETESLMNKSSNKLIERCDKSFKMIKEVIVNINQTINEKINNITDSLNSLTEELADANKKVDGQWAYWSSWTSCSVSCGTGMILRTRRCTNPMLENNGKDCFGQSLQSSRCYKPSCSAGMSAFSVKEPKSYTKIDRVDRLTFSRYIYQIGNDFSPSTGTFTCSIPGVYYFSATLVKKRESFRVDRVYCRLYNGGEHLATISLDPTDDDTDKGNAAITQSVVTHLKVGNKVYLTDCISQPSRNMEDWTTFTGFLIFHTD